MSKKLAGTLFIYNGLSQDYCFEEAIRSLKEFCDHVFIVDAGSTDGTVKHLHQFNDSDTTLITLFNSEWQKQKGKEKLNYFTNIAIQEAQDAGYEYQFNLQGDEIVHQNSYIEIRKAIETGHEGYMCNRINLWHSPYLQLDVPQERKPCNTSIIRLTKTKYRSVDDAENIAVPLVNTYFEAGIRIYHMGFVRKREIMPNKIRHIQQEVFGMEHADSKLDGMDIFDPTKWFDPETDLKPIDEPLPLLIQDWAKNRHYE